MCDSKIVLFTAIILSVLFVPVFGKADDLQSDDNKILARINNYKLTAGDFKSETQGKLTGDLSPSDFEKAKEGLLDEIITKKLLIQEAQKQNFDKDRAFIKEIERYWEQALLKLLYKKKSRELLREISRDESDPEIRDRLVQQALNAWIDDLKSRADIKKYRENLRAVKAQPKGRNADGK